MEERFTICGQDPHWHDLKKHEAHEAALAQPPTKMTAATIRARLVTGFSIPYAELRDYAANLLAEEYKVVLTFRGGGLVDAQRFDEKL